VALPGVRWQATVCRLLGVGRGGTVVAGAAAGAIAGLGYDLLVTGKLTLDTGWGRRVRPLGPFSVEITAPGRHRVRRDRRRTWAALPAPWPPTCG